MRYSPRRRRPATVTINPKPAAIAPPLLSYGRTVDHLVQAAAVVALVIGIITVARWLDSVRHPLAPVGMVCWHVERVTATGRQRQDQCEPAEGWHVEEWPGVGRTVVPDDAKVVRRYPVRD
jgi:hypothetical protein